MLRSINDLQGYTVLATDGEIGKVDEFYFEDTAWTVRYMVVKTGEWLSEQRVLLLFGALGQPDWASRIFPVNLSKERVRNSPAIDFAKPVSRQLEEELHAYYGWPIYWIDREAALNPDVPRQYPAISSVPVRARGLDELHLRSTHEVSGYHIKAVDGEIGHIADYVVDDETWIIRYLVVDTGNWLPGKQVLLSPAWVMQIDWVDSKAHVSLSQDAVKGSPEYDPAYPINRAYEQRLYDYYGRPVYWSGS